MKQPPKKEKEKEGFIAFFINSIAGLTSLLAGVNALALVGLTILLVGVCIIL